MKKLSKILCSLFLVCSLSACDEKVEALDKTKVYETEQANLKFRGMEIVKEVKPTNQNDEYTYRYSTDEDVEILDVQFYIENKTDKEINVYESIDVKSIGDEEADYEVCVETDHMMNVNEEGKLAPNESSIAHVMFYLDQNEIKEVKGENSPVLTLLVGGTPYTMTYEEIKPSVEKVELIQALDFDEFEVRFISGSASRIIPALNFESEDAEWYECEEDDKQYAGGYLEITNKTDQPLNLMNEIAFYLGIADEKPISAWFSILSEDQAIFEDTNEIPANSTRMVLLFIEVPLDYEDTDYTMFISVDGKPFGYTYTHIVIVR